MRNTKAGQEVENIGKKYQAKMNDIFGKWHGQESESLITPQKDSNRSAWCTHSPHQQISQRDIHGNVGHLNRSRQPTQFSRCLKFQPTERYVLTEDHATAKSHNGDHLIATTSPLQSEKVKRSEDGDRYSHFYSLCSYYDYEQFEGDLYPKNAWDSQEYHVENDYSLLSTPM